MSEKRHIGSIGLMVFSGRVADPDPDIRPIILPDTGYSAGYPAKNKLCYFFKLNIFFFNCSSFGSSNPSFVSLNFLKFLGLNNLVAIAHNIYNDMYAATG